MSHQHSLGGTWGVTYVWVLLQLVLDEPKKMFLVHTSRVVNMGIDLSDIVKVTSKSASVPFDDLHSVPMRNSLWSSARPNQREDQLTFISASS